MEAGAARAGWETVLELMTAAVDDAAFRPGMVAVVQTAGDLGNWQPHLHAMVSRGGWTRDWEWVPVPYVDEHSAELLFRHKVMRLLQDEGLLNEERSELLLSWRHTGFSVHNRVKVEPEDQPAVERLTRYIMRPPISLERMQWDGVGEVPVIATRAEPPAQVSGFVRYPERFLPDETLPSQIDSMG